MPESAFERPSTRLPRVWRECLCMMYISCSCVRECICTRTRSDVTQRRRRVRTYYHKPFARTVRRESQFIAQRLRHAGHVSHFTDQHTSTRHLSPAFGVRVCLYMCAYYARVPMPHIFAVHVYHTLFTQPSRGGGETVAHSAVPHIYTSICANGQSVKYCMHIFAQQ